MTHQRTKNSNSPTLTSEQLFALLNRSSNGEPDYGAILRYHRHRAGWTGERLAYLYSEALDEEEPVSRFWVYRMEDQNKVPVDEKRRWILARLLDIPPALFGLPILAEGLPVSWFNMFDPLSEEKVDLVEYRATLEDYRHSWFAGENLSYLQTIRDFSRRIHVLEQRSHGERGVRKKEMLRLLCEYYLLMASAANEMQDFQKSIHLCSWIITLAEMYTFYDIWAYALRQRGHAYASRGELTAALTDFTAAREDFEAAVADFDAIKKIEAHLSGQRKGTIWIFSSLCYAHVAQDQASLSHALKLIDRGERLMGEDHDDFAFSLQFDEGRILRTRGMALINSPIKALRAPTKALADFEQAMQFTAPTAKRSLLANALRQAEAYFHAEKYEMAVAYGQQALELVQGTDVLQDLKRLDNLYRRLRHSPFGQDGDVIEFGMELLRVQKPDLFQ
jgi:tetratricopeptide (TPR) repeat protein